jgi:lipopolysaccharide exporter
MTEEARTPRISDPGRNDALLEKTAGGAGWTIAWRTATRALGFVSTLLLVRILIPADFGLVALALSFSRAIDVFSELGVHDALVRATKSSRDIYNAAFTISAVRGLATTVVIAISAGPFAVFFDEPRLFYVVLALAPTVLLDALENVGVTDFRRDLDFRREFRLSILPRIVQVVVTITLALTWANYWVLVVGMLTSRTLYLIASYVMHPFRPRLSLAGWREISSFSAWTWLVSMARMIQERGVIMVIGGILNPTALGIFTVGSEVASLPETELIGPLTRACFSGFAAAQRAGSGLAEAYLRITSATLVITMPAAIGISAIAAPLVYTAFGPNWLEAIPITEIVAVAGVFAVVDRISETMLSALAFLRPLLWNVVTVSVIQFTLLAVLVPHAGIVGAAVASAVTMAIQQAVLSIFVSRRLAIRSRDLLSRIWRSLLAATAMVVMLALSGLGWAGAAPQLSANLARLFVTSGSGAAVYIATLLCLWLAAGQPSGPETDLLRLFIRVGSRALRFVRYRLVPVPTSAE